jgi:hypothetical protein
MALHNFHKVIHRKMAVTKWRFLFNSHFPHSSQQKNYKTKPSFNWRLKKLSTKKPPIADYGLFIPSISRIILEKPVSPEEKNPSPGKGSGHLPPP